MKINLKWLIINYWFFSIFSFLLCVALGPVYGAGDSDFETEQVSRSPDIKCINLDVAFDPEMYGMQYFYCSFVGVSHVSCLSADLRYNTLYVSGKEFVREVSAKIEMAPHVQDVNVSIRGIFNLFKNQTILAIPGMVISEEGVDLQEDFTDYGDNICVLDCIPREIKKTLIDDLIKAGKDLAYCRDCFENQDDPRLKFLEALFARVESLP
jgi:hypothetical protein